MEHTERNHLRAVRREEERVTPLELFFDLVFVLAITQCTALMSNDPTWTGVAQAGVVAAGEHEQGDLREAHDRVGAGEQQRLVGERPRHAQRHHQERGHGGEHHQPHGALLGVDHAGQPRVADP